MEVSPSNKFTANFILPIFVLLCLCFGQQQADAYELRAVPFERSCQVWYYDNDQPKRFGAPSQRVPIYFFYDPAPFLQAQTWRTSRKFVFIHPINKQLHQLSQESINKAKRICNVEKSAQEIPLANQTIFSADNYYSYYGNGNRWRSINQYNPSETFTESDFRGYQLARFLRPNGTEQSYQVWRDKGAKGQCKASLVYESERELTSNRISSSQLAFEASQLRRMRTYPLYNCRVANYSCKGYHVFLVDEDDMKVYEVNMVEETRYENRWDLIPSNQLGSYWSNASFFPEGRRQSYEFSDHCSYAQDFQTLTPQSLGKNMDYIRPNNDANNAGDFGSTEDAENSSAEADADWPNGNNDWPNENNGGGDRRTGNRGGSTSIANNNGRRGSSRPNSPSIVHPPSRPQTPTRNGYTGADSGGRANGRGGGGGADLNVANSSNDNDNSSDDDSSSEIGQTNGANNNSEEQEQTDENGNGDQDGIQVSSGNKINIDGNSGGGGGKFTLDENNNISIGGKWTRGKSRRPNISMSRQTNIKMGRRRRR